MRANRKVFWVSIIAGLISIAAIIISSKFYKCYKFEYLDIIKNVSMSLLGGAFLSAVTTWVAFDNIKKHYLITFNNEYVNLANLIKELTDWFNWNYNEIKYGKIRNKEIDKINDEKVKKFFTIEELLRTYNYAPIYEILDDFCSLYRKNKRFKTWGLMKKMLNSVLDYNIYSMKNEKSSYALYRIDIYDEYLLYEKVIKSFKDKATDDNIKKLLKLQTDYLKETKINEYLEKIYKQE